MGWVPAPTLDATKSMISVKVMSQFSFFSRGYAKHRNDYLLGDRLCKCVTHSDVNFWPRTWRVWVPVSCKPPKLPEVKAAILVLVERFFESV